MISVKTKFTNMLMTAKLESAVKEISQGYKNTGIFLDLPLDLV